MALQNETLILPGEKEPRSEALITANAKKIGIRVRECRVLEPTISTHVTNVSNDFSRT